MGRPPLPRITRLRKMQIVYSGALTSDEFDNVVQQVLAEKKPGSKPIAQKTLHIAQAVLVDGKGCSDVAKEHQMTYQRVRDICLKFLANSEKRNWVVLDVRVPADFKSEIEALVAEKLQEMLDQQQNVASPTTGEQA